jgi:hypothetical protein
MYTNLESYQHLQLLYTIVKTKLYLLGDRYKQNLNLNFCYCKTQVKTWGDGFHVMYSKAYQGSTRQNVGLLNRQNILYVIYFLIKIYLSEIYIFFTHKQIEICVLIFGFTVLKFIVKFYLVISITEHFFAY